jgi:hypothetical protein
MYGDDIITDLLYLLTGYKFGNAWQQKRKLFQDAQSDEVQKSDNPKQYTDLSTYVGAQAIQSLPI